MAEGADTPTYDNLNRLIDMTAGQFKQMLADIKAVGTATPVSKSDGAQADAIRSLTDAMRAFTQKFDDDASEQKAKLGEIVDVMKEFNEKKEKKKAEKKEDKKKNKGKDNPSPKSPNKSAPSYDATIDDMVEIRRLTKELDGLGDSIWGKKKKYYAEEMNLAVVQLARQRKMTTESFIAEAARNKSVKKMIKDEAEQGNKSKADKDLSKAYKFKHELLDFSDKLGVNLYQKLKEIPLLEIDFSRNIRKAAYETAGVTAASEELLKTYENIGQKTDETGVDRIHYQKQFTKSIKNGVRDLKMAEKITTNQLYAERQLGLEAGELEDTFENMAMHNNMNSVQIDAMSRGMKEVARSAGLSGGAFKAAVQASAQLVTNLRNTGNLTAQSAKSMLELSANAQKFGVQAPIAEYAKSMTSMHSLMFETDDKTKALILQSAAEVGKMDEAVNGTLLNTKKGNKLFGEGMEKNLEKRFGFSLEKFEEMDEAEKAALNTRVKLATGKDVGELKQMIKTFKDTGKTSVDKIKEINDKLKSQVLTKEEKDALSKDQSNLEKGSGMDLLTAFSESAKTAKTKDEQMAVFGKNLKNYSDQLQVMGYSEEDIASGKVKGEDVANAAFKKSLEEVNKSRKEQNLAELKIDPKEFANAVAMGGKAGQEVQRDLIEKLNKGEREVATAEKSGLTAQDKMEQYLKSIADHFGGFTNSFLGWLTGSVAQGVMMLAAIGSIVGPLYYLGVQAKQMLATLISIKDSLLGKIKGDGGPPDKGTTPSPTSPPGGSPPGSGGPAETKLGPKKEKLSPEEAAKKEAKSRSTMEESMAKSGKTKEQYRAERKMLEFEIKENKELSGKQKKQMIEEVRRGDTSVEKAREMLSPKDASKAAGTAGTGADKGTIPASTSAPRPKGEIVMPAKTEVPHGTGAGGPTTISPPKTGPHAPHPTAATKPHIPMPAKTAPHSPAVPHGPTSPAGHLPTGKKNWMSKAGGFFVSMKDKTAGFFGKVKDKVIGSGLAEKVADATGMGSLMEGMPGYGQDCTPVCIVGGLEGLQGAMQGGGMLEGIKSQLENATGTADTVHDASEMLKKTDKVDDAVKTGAKAADKADDAAKSASKLKSAKGVDKIDDVAGAAGKTKGGFFSRTKDFMGKGFDKAKDVGGGVLSKAKDVGGGVLSKAKDVGGGVLSKAKDVGAAGIGKVKNVAGGLLGKSGGAISKLGTVAGDSLKVVGNTVGKYMGPLSLALGGLTGALEAEEAGRGTVEGTIYGALTGGAKTGSMFSSMLGIEEGSSTDELLGVAGAAGTGAATGAAIGSVVPVIGTAIGGAVGGVIGGGAEIVKIFTAENSNLRNAISGFGSTIWNGVSSVGSTLMSGVSSIGSGIASVGSTIWDGASSIGSGIAGMGSSLWNAVTGVGSALTGMGTVLWDGTTELGSEIMSGVSNMASSLYEGATNLGSSIADKAVEAGATVMNAVSSVATNIADSDIGKAAGSAVGGAGDILSGDLMGGASKVGSAVVDGLAAVGSGVVKSAAAVGEALNPFNWFEEGTREIKQGGLAMLHPGEMIIPEDVWNQIKAMGSGAFGGVGEAKGTFDGLLSTLSAPMNGLTDMAMSLGSSLVEKMPPVGDLMSGVTGAFSSVLSPMKDLMGGGALEKIGTSLLGSSITDFASKLVGSDPQATEAQSAFEKMQAEAERAKAVTASTFAPTVDLQSKIATKKATEAPPQNKVTSDELVGIADTNEEQVTLQRQLVTLFQQVVEAMKPTSTPMQSGDGVPGDTSSNTIVGKPANYFKNAIGSIYQNPGKAVLNVGPPKA